MASRAADGSDVDVTATAAGRALGGRSGAEWLTVPNLITLARLAAVPVFLWLLYGRDSPLGAALLLGALGATDWVDGWFARRYGQQSQVGAVLDPTADRILLGVAVVTTYLEGAVPGVVFWLVIVREVAISVAVVALALLRGERIGVLWAGKAGAFALMFAFPLFLLAHAVSAFDDVWRVLAWGCAAPGIVLGYIAAFEYARLAPAALRAGRRGPEEGVSP